MASKKHYENIYDKAEKKDGMYKAVRAVLKDFSKRSVSRFFRRNDPVAQTVRDFLKAKSQPQPREKPSQKEEQSQTEEQSEIGEPKELPGSIRIESGDEAEELLKEVAEKLIDNDLDPLDEMKKLGKSEFQKVMNVIKTKTEDKVDFKHIAEQVVEEKAQKESPEERPQGPQ